MGGRQSAHEWAALLGEAGADAVHLVYRHEPPRFEPSDWSWVYSLVERSEQSPGPVCRHDAGQRRRFAPGFWVEGRLKLEPWLAPRLADDRIHTHPGATLAECHLRSDDSLAVTLTNGAAVDVDHVIFATGRDWPDLSRVSYLTHPSIRDSLDWPTGFRCLTRGFRRLFRDCMSQPSPPPATTDRSSVSWSAVGWPREWSRRMQLRPSSDG